MEVILGIFLIFCPECMHPHLEKKKKSSLHATAKITANFSSPLAPSTSVFHPAFLLGRFVFFRSGPAVVGGSYVCVWLFVGWLFLLLSTFSFTSLHSDSWFVDMLTCFLVSVLM